MTKPPRRVLRQLDRLYSQLPVVHCQGRCAHSCGEVAVKPAELERILDRVGVVAAQEIRPHSCVCPFLADGRCSVYDIRPLMCRVWGSVERGVAHCPYDCRVEPRPLTTKQLISIVRRINQISPGCRSLHPEIDIQLRATGAKSYTFDPATATLKMKLTLDFDLGDDYDP